MSKTFRLFIETDNAAFEDEPDWEVAAILEKTAKRLRDGGYRRIDEDDDTLRLYDTNGNKVGECYLEDED